MQTKHGAGEKSRGTWNKYQCRNTGFYAAKAPLLFDTDNTKATRLPNSSAEDIGNLCHTASVRVPRGQSPFGRSSQ
jgi:hypothetical protein